MAVQFTPIDTNTGYLHVGPVKIFVTNEYSHSYPGQTHQTQLDCIHEMITTGSCSQYATFDNLNGVSSFRIQNDQFYLEGGTTGPAFGSSVEFTVSYTENKSELDKFLNFMLCTPKD